MLSKCSFSLPMAARWLRPILGGPFTSGTYLRRFDESEKADGHARPFFSFQFEANGKPYRHAVYAYRIRALNRFGMLSGPSPATLTIPSIVDYPFAKEEGNTATRLKWRASPEKNIKGYLVYRHNGRFSNSSIVRLTPKPITETTFFDKEAGKGTRRYEVVAVDTLGQEGIPSRPVWSRREWQQYYVPYTKEWHQ